ncbi:MAG: Arm DNA-binding domain-containing protein, partial [Azonexus sp.]|nr:Arm DNA-binding domain-containing protein [Azonexus sp.]
MGKLTDVELRNCIKAGQPVNKTDGDGLTFTLSAKGTAAWTLRFRIGGRRKELTLGRYPDMSIAKARELAAEKRVAVSQGVDVAQEKQTRKESAKLAATLAKVGTVKALYE